MMEPDTSSPGSSGDVTALLLDWNLGNKAARDRLITRVYQELRRIASRSMRAERSEHTLQPTALVHETYKKLIDQTRVQWRNRAHFFAVAAGLMRRVLVDHARRRGRLRRGGGVPALSIVDEVEPAAEERPVDLIALDAALTELSQLDPDQARIVELRFFAGLNLEETAEAVGSSRATVHRDWTMARAWLHRRLASP